MRAGVHTSIAGALENAAHRAHEIGCDAFQMFSANPRGWRAQRISEAACNKFCEVRAGHGLTPLAIHANYLINLAAPDAVIRALSVAAFRAELQRAIAFGADYVVLHPGSARNGERGRAVAGFRESLLQAARGILRHPKLKSLPFICETPIDEPGDDWRSLANLRNLRDGEEGSRVRSWYQDDGLELP